MAKTEVPSLPIGPGYLEIKRRSNPFYPLPADYEDLTEAGQKLARVSTVSDHSTPARFVEAWDLFKRLYLMTLPAGSFYNDFHPSPQFHFTMVHDLGRHGRNAQAAPRGFAKSTVIGLEIPLMLLLTVPHIKIALGMATDNLVSGRFDTIMGQLTDNPYILNDFGTVKPTRGSRTWNHHRLNLANGSLLEGFSVMGRKRGARPRLFIMDDPEFDPDSESEQSQALVRAKFERVLVRQVIPMLEKGSAIFWIGTIISVRSMLYYVLNEEDNRFKAWNRRIWASGLFDENPIWDGKWDLDYLEARREEIGDAAFYAEYENTPASEDERLLKIDARKNEYRLCDDSSADGMVVVSPESGTDHYDPFLDERTLVYWDRPRTGGKEYEKFECKFCQKVIRMYRFICFDFAQGLRQINDYSCVCVMGLDQSNCLWILDMWLGRAKRPELMHHIYKLGRRWQVRMIGIESVGIQSELVDCMDEYMETVGALEVGWKPRVVGIRYPANTSKAQRIGGLESRFSVGKIKYPAHLKDKWPFNQLYSQTLSFTYDLNLLAHDDAIDTVAMHQYMIKSKGVKAFEAPEKKPDPARMIRDGRLHDDLGMPVIAAAGPGGPDPLLAQAALDAQHRGEYNRRNEFRRNRRRYLAGRKTNVIVPKRS